MLESSLEMGRKVVRSVDRIHPYLIAASLAVLATIPVADCLTWPASHDGLRYHFLTIHFHDALEHGVWYPRFLPHAAGGFGYPTFVYYQPGFFFVSALFTSLTGQASTGVYMCLLSFAFLGALGAYRLGSLRGGPGCGLIAAVFFVLTPYSFVNLLVRSDLGEWAAMMLCPWAVDSLCRLRGSIDAAKSPLIPMLNLSFALTAIAYCHPAVILVAGPALGLLAVVLVWGQKDLWGLLSCFAVASGLALALSNPYWAPLFQMREYVSYEDAISGYFMPRNHFVELSQFVSPKWGFGFSEPGPHDGMSFQLGLPHLVLALAGFWWGRRDPLVVGAAILYVVHIWLMTDYSAFIWNNVDVLRFVQFPWRLLSVTATWQIVMAIGLCSAIRETKPRIVVGIATVVIVLWWYSGIFFTDFQRIPEIDRALEEHRESWHASWQTFAARDEFTPRTAARISARGSRGDLPIVESLGARKLEFAEDHNDFRIHVRIGDGAASHVRINQLYLPGWRVHVNHAEISRQQLERSLTDDGRMLIAIPAASSGDLTASYDGPPGKPWRYAGIVIGLAAFAVFIWGRQRRPRLVPLAALT